MGGCRAKFISNRSGSFIFECDSLTARQNDKKQNTASRSSKRRLKRERRAIRRLAYYRQMLIVGAFMYIDDALHAPPAPVPMMIA
jgi:hypothetical protein